MFSTTQVLLASLIIIAIIIGIFGYVFYSMQGPTVPTVPVEVYASLNLSCTTQTNSLGGFYQSVISSIKTYLDLGVKNHLGSDIYVDKIYPVGVNISGYAVFTSLKVKPYKYINRTIPVNWLNMTGLITRAYPGDVYVLKGGTLEKEESGVVKVYSGSLPTSQPSNYACPFQGNILYDATVNGDIMSATVANPGCAPLYYAKNPGSDKLLVLGTFSVIDYYYDEYDMPLYVHIYGNPKTDVWGVYYRGGGDSGYGFGLIQLYKRNPWTATEYWPDKRNPMYFAYWIDSTTGKIELYADDNTAPVLTDTEQISPYSLQNIVIGLAREKPAKSSLYLALVLDNSISMQDDWESLYSAIKSAINVLKDKNVYLALEDFTGPNCNCHNSAYCDTYIRIQSDFTQDYELILNKISNTPTWCSAIEPDADAIYKAVNKLSWSNKPSDVNVILLATDECDQAVFVSHQQAVQAAKSKDIKIFVVREANADNQCWPATYKTGYKLDSYATATGGQVFVIGQNAGSLGQALIKLIESINLTPADIKTEVPYIGVFRDRTITIKSLYPGDKIILSTPTKVVSLQANNSVETIDLLKFFGPEDLVLALKNGGIYLAIQPSSQHVLSLLPARALVHVTGKDIDTWLLVPLLLKPHCKLTAGFTSYGIVSIERAGDLYKVYMKVPGFNNLLFLGTFTKVYINLRNYEIDISYMDGTTATIKPGVLTKFGGIDTVFNNNIEILLISDKIVIVNGMNTLHDTKPFRAITIKGAVDLEMNFAK